MQELIDRYATMDAIPAPTDADEAEYYGKICDVIETMPAIKSDVRRGRWIAEEDADGDISFVCSECSRRLRWDEDFCPSCGSDMHTADMKD